MISHVPVLLKEVIEGLNINPSGKYIDATFGAGGHSKAILDKLDSNGRLMCFDQDDEVKENVPDDDRLIFAPANFQYILHYLDYHDWKNVDGIMADIGVSSHHLDTKERGFSFRFDAVLDMRMNRQAEKTAQQVLNQYSEVDLVEMFSKYGEVRNAKSLARCIVEERKQSPFSKTLEFVDRISHLIRGQRERYLAQVFQAVRMEVNNELGVLGQFLQSATEALKSGGVLAIISFHSLEDRLVKRWMKNGSLTGETEKDFYGKIKTPFERGSGKVITAGKKELEKNPRSRSAKLRIGIKK